MVSLRAAAVLLVFASGCLAVRTANRSPTIPNETQAAAPEVVHYDRTHSEPAANPPQPRDSAAALEVVDYDNNKKLETTPYGLLIACYFASRGEYDRAVRSLGRGLGSIFAFYHLDKGFSKTFEATGSDFFMWTQIAFAAASISEHYVEGLVSRLIANPIIRSTCRQIPKCRDEFLDDVSKHFIFGGIGSLLVSAFGKVLGTKVGGLIDTATAATFIYAFGYFYTRDHLIPNILKFLRQRRLVRFRRAFHNAERT